MKYNNRFWRAFRWLVEKILGEQWHIPPALPQAQNKGGGE